MWTQLPILQFNGHGWTTPFDFFKFSQLTHPSPTSIKFHVVVNLIRGDCKPSEIKNIIANTLYVSFFEVDGTVDPIIDELTNNIQDEDSQIRFPCHVRLWFVNARIRTCDSTTAFSYNTTFFDYIQDMLGNSKGAERLGDLFILMPTIDYQRKNETCILQTMSCMRWINFNCMLSWKSPWRSNHPYWWSVEQCKSRTTQAMYSSQPKKTMVSMKITHYNISYHNQPPPNIKSSK
jgi:hypothetical protein